MLPYRCLARFLEVFGLKAIIVRPGLEGWNAISLEMNREDMLIAIGETVWIREHRQRYRRKKGE